MFLIRQEANVLLKVATEHRDPLLGITFQICHFKTFSIHLNRWTHLVQLFVSAFVCRPSIDLNNHIPHAGMTHQNRILPALCRLHKHRQPQAYIAQLCFFFHGLSESQTNTQMLAECLFLPLCDGPTHMSPTMRGHLLQHAPFFWPKNMTLNLPNKRHLTVLISVWYCELEVACTA